MSGRWDEVETDEGPMRCYVAMPQKTPAPGIIVAQHAGGVDEFVRGMTDRFAGAGFVAVAPDLYHREDPDSKDDPMTRMSRLRDNTIVSDMNAAAAHARGLPELQGQKLGVTGFCMGGRVAYLMAAASDDYSASIVFWGGNIMMPWGGNMSPFDMTDKISCPVLGLFGEDDPNPTPADVAKIDAEMSRLGKTHEFHSYPGAGHAFMNEGRPSYRPEATADARKRAVAFFRQHLD
jgi:carboxymethylenebutenolidase